MEAIILVGGKGTRLKKEIKDTPKPLAPINGKPFLTYLMDRLIKNKVTHFILSTGYKKEYIHQYFRDSYKGVKISYATEKTPLGTGGAILNSLKHCKTELVYALNGDIYTNYQIDKLNHNHNDSHISLALIDYNDSDIDRFGRIEIEEDCRIKKFLEKGKKSKTNFISAGIYLINRNWYTGEFKNLNQFSIEFDVFEKCKKYKFKGIPQQASFIDIGTPESYNHFIEISKKIKI